jgi:hypothetical protein
MAAALRGMQPFRFHELALSPDKGFGYTASRVMLRLDDDCMILRFPRRFIN